ncbi:hypothetical protein [Hymenobacter sp. BT730]|uniref:hypothetical protein n=1 Tax=Hymenobacter sp. BT730 TaxID=3063332 RepID=UPI0026DEFF40|nr:hypothetical protein [Hymenobacter sp. BT730]
MLELIALILLQLATLFNSPTAPKPNTSASAATENTPATPNNTNTGGGTWGEGH